MTYTPVGDSFDIVRTALSDLRNVITPDLVAQITEVASRLEELGVCWNPNPTVDEEALLSTLRALENFTRMGFGAREEVKTSA